MRRAKPPRSTPAPTDSASVREQIDAAGAVVLAGTLSFAGCSAPLPDPPSVVGEDYPAGGVPLGVAWPSDWLEGFVGETDAARGAIVGLRLEQVGDQWVWRVRSADPERRVNGEMDDSRGLEALVDAESLALGSTQRVQLSEAEIEFGTVGAWDAARLSGEVYPTLRLIELTREIRQSRAVWRITTLVILSSVRP